MKSKILTALLSVVIAVGLWFYVVTVISPNSDKEFNNIPVGIQGTKVLEERNLMIMSTDVTTVKLHLEGNRVDLNKLSSASITADVDVSKIYEAGTYELRYTTTFGDMPSSAFTVLEKTPGSVKVVVEEKVTKTIPVHIEYTGEVAQNHRAETDEVVLDVESVTITGPKSVIDTIAMARVDVKLDGNKESLNTKLPIILCNANKEPVDAQHVVTNVAEVVLSLRIVGIKEVPLVYEVLDGSGATKDTTKFVLSPATVKISGSDAQLATIDEIKLGTIDLSTILTDTQVKRDIKLPEGTEGVKIDSDVKQATIDVSFPALAIKTVTVSNIQVIGEPVGYKVSLETVSIDIQFRGPKANMEAFTEEDIVVTVDFSGAQEGTAEQVAVITWLDSKVGAINPDAEYVISAKIEKNVVIEPDPTPVITPEQTPEQTPDPA